MWFVYMVRCGDNSLYTGIATDVTRRVTEHQKQTPRCAKYLRGRTPITLVFQEPHPNRAEASRREWFIKSMDKKDKEALIQAAFTQKP